MRRYKLLVSFLLLVAPAMMQADNNDCASCGSCCPVPIVRNTESCGNSCCPIAVTQNADSCCQSCGSESSCACACSGKTFFSARPMYQSVRPELISEFRNDRLKAASEHASAALDFVVFGGQSTKSSKLGSYFMPFCQQDLVVSEKLQDISTPSAAFKTQANILSDHFNIYTKDGNFQSVFSIKARQSAVGLGLHYKQAFCYNDERTKWWYLDVNTPVMHLKNEVTLCEVVTSSGGGVSNEVPGAVANMTQAFNQDAWLYGKIRNNCPQRKTGLADIEIKLGRQLNYSDDYFASVYFGMLVPTGNVPRGEYIFEPVIGHGKHMGLLWGGEAVFDFFASKDDNWHFSLVGNANALYLFTKTQKRSFDLKNRPWSRYMQVYQDKAQAQLANDQGNVTLATPGINVFTQDVKVRPGLIVNSTTGVQFRRGCGFTSELGYNFYARQEECVRLACEWQEGPALKAAEGLGFTNPVRNITNNANINNDNINNAVDVYEESIIRATDLDLQSAAHPFTFIQMVYGTVGYIWDCHPKATFDASAGGSYEFGNNAGALHRWALWGKAGVAF